MNVNIIKAKCDTPTAHIILYWGKTEAFSSKIRNKTKVSLSTLLLDIVLEVLARSD